MLIRRHETGSAAIEVAFALVFLLFLALGAIEVAFALYGRNVVLASAHEAARAAVERGRDPSEAGAIARATVERAAGGLIDGLEVDVETARSEATSLVIVRVRGVVDAWGPVPLPLPVSAVGRASTEIVR